MGNIYFDEDELLSFEHAEIRNAEIAEIALYYWSNVRINEFVMSDSTYWKMYDATAFKTQCTQSTHLPSIAIIKSQLIFS